MRTKYHDFNMAHCLERFGNKESTLIAAIVDADSNIVYGEFFPSEDTISCMTVLQRIIERKGLFEILYVDRVGIFGGHKRMEFSQVKPSRTTQSIRNSRKMNRNSARVGWCLVGSLTRKFAGAATQSHKSCFEVLFFLKRD